MINQVDVIARSDRATRPAKVKDQVRAPDWVRTGAKARAELLAPDQTLTRIGANSLFSFDVDERTVRLDQGSLLLHSPPGKGGGTVRTGGAVAAVLGTTLIVSATADGGFKAILLEGRGKVSLPNGNTRHLRAGQLVFVLGGSREFGPLLDINLGKLVEGSALIRSFERKLPSLGRIEREIHRQDRLLEAGDLEDTGELIGGQLRESERKLGASDASILDRIFGDEYIPEVRFALSRDAHITQPNLDVRHVFLEMFDLQLYNFPFDDYVGFAARNITLQTPRVVLGPFAGTPPSYFDIVAAKLLEVRESVEFSHASALPLFLTGIEALNLTDGITLRYENEGGLHLISGGATRVTDARLQAPGGPLWVQSVNGDLTVASSRAEGASVELHAGGDLVVTDSVLSGADRTVVASLSNRLAPKPGDLSTVSTDSGPYGVVGNIHVSRTQISGGGTGSLMMRAADVLRLDTVQLSGLRSLSLAAQTLDLREIDFPAGSSVSLASTLGVLAPQPNTGAPSLPGHVNFIRNVNYGGAPAQQAIGSGITILPLAPPVGGP